MIDSMRQKVVTEFRKMLDRGVLKKRAIERVKEKFGVSRRSLYRYCERFGVSLQ